MGASLALAGLTGCTRQPTEFIMPYVRQPEELIPGRPLFYATAMPLGGYATGLLVESHEGRPTKAEGNPEHPASLGACDPYSQAAILGLYDPDRSQALSFAGRDPFLGRLPEHDARGAATAGDQARRGTAHSHRNHHLAHAGRPDARHSDGAARTQNGTRGNRPPRTPRAPAHSLHSASRCNTYYDLSKADVIVSLDCNFLAAGPGFLRYARQFAAKRRVRGNQTDMNRLYVLEPMPTPTGTKADHRMPARVEEVEQFTWELAAVVGSSRAAMGRNRRIRISTTGWDRWRAT